MRVSYNRDLPEPLVTVVIPTLVAGAVLEECLAGLRRQTFRGFEVIIVDNSAEGRARGCASGEAVRVIENRRNAGFGAAVNQGIAASRSPYVASLNDDAVPGEGWLGALVDALEETPEAGMCASQVRLAGEEVLDSAGMLIAADGSSKQRGHRRPPQEFSATEEVLLPSASAALYRRAMLEETGGFDESFFLYSEDTDLGLRARWAGWKCLYAPGAVVEHRYSHSAGKASPLKAYCVERNRLFLIVKNFPALLLLKALFAAAGRYWWHLVSLFEGRGAASQFLREGSAGWELPWIVLKVHLAAAGRLPDLCVKRRAIRRTARISAREFGRLLSQYSITLREVAAL